MSTDPLHFTPYDAELILKSLTAGYNAGSNGKTRSEGERRLGVSADTVVLVAPPDAAPPY